VAYPGSAHGIIRLESREPLSFMVAANPARNYLFSGQFCTPVPDAAI